MPVTVSRVAGGSGIVNVVISSAAQIRNPSSPGNYSLDVSTSKQTIPATSPTWSITAGSTTISAAAVTPSPSVESRSARYTISFAVGEGGYLNPSSTITLTFPAGTFVPSGSIAGVTVNGSSTTAIGSGQTVTINSPVEVANEGTVNLIFSKSSGLKNPTVGSYVLSAYTSSETTPVNSDTYSISSAANLSFSSITALNDTVNAKSQYTIEFVVSNTGALDPVQGDLIKFTFPSTFRLPTSIAVSNITITNLTTGFGNNPLSSSVSGNSISMGVPVAINNTDEVRVVFNSAATANIQNPSTAGNYQIDAETLESDGTTTIDAPTSSNPFAIIATTTSITQPAVILTSQAASATGVDYEIDFNVGRYGALDGGVGTISVTFPSGTSFGGGLAAQINNTPASVSTSSLTLTVTVPASLSIDNNDPIALVFNDVTNPGAGTNYTLTVNTSSETINATSLEYTIGGTAVSVGNPTLGNTGVNQISSYTIPITTGSRLNRASTNDFIRFVFPVGTTLPSSINTADMTLSGSNPASVTVNTSTRTITAVLNARINASTFNVVIGAGAGIINNSIPTNYTLQVSASQETQPATSSPYTFVSNATSPTVGTVSVSPAVANGGAAAYEIPFTTSANGRLKGGTSFGSNTITIRFSTATIVPGVGMMDPSNVSVSGITVSSLTINSPGAGGIITLSVPSGVEIGNNSSSTIIFNSSAGLVNGIVAGTYTVNVRTNADNTFSTQTNNMTLATTSPLTINSVSNTPNTINAAASYSIGFTTGSLGALSIGDSVIVTFPTNTFVPNPFSRNDILLDGLTPTGSPSVYNNGLTIAVPVSQAISADETTSIQFSSIGEILNPTLVSSTYTLTMETVNSTGVTIEGPVTSPSYSTTATASAISTPSVSLSVSTPSSLSNYTISFNTGTGGRLIAGTSTFRITFPSGTDVSTVTSQSINGVAVTAQTINTTNRTVEMTVPSSVSIGNNAPVTVIINGITNPASTASYTLNANTSVETNLVSSTAYSVTNTSALTINSISVVQDTVNAPIDHVINVTTDATAGSLVINSGTITVFFPTNSTVPVSIPSGSVTINGVAATTITSDIGSKSIRITTPVNIANAQTFDIAILPSSGLLNPSEPDGTLSKYRYRLKTSSQPVEATSSAFNIVASVNTSVSALGVEISPQVTGQPVSWTWTFTTEGRGALAPSEGTIFLNFDTSVFTQNPIPTSAVQVMGTTAEAVTINGSIVEISVPAGATITNGYEVTVVFSASAGIEVDPTLAKSTSRAKGDSDSFDFNEIMNNTFQSNTSSETTPTASNTNPLPVELTELMVENIIDPDFPTIQWQTATERNNYGFRIERKDVDASDRWDEVGFIRGQDNSTEKTNYEFTDYELSIAGVYQYRLVQIDFDGKQEIFGPIEFTFASPEQFKLENNYPNPFNPETTIPYQVASDARVTIEVFDILGKKIRTLVDKDHQPGKYNIRFGGNDLSSGMYFIRMTSNGMQFTKKALFLK